MNLLAIEINNENQFEPIICDVRYIVVVSPLPSNVDFKCKDTRL